jgi:hypothetical protein
MSSFVYFLTEQRLTLREYSGAGFASAIFVDLQLMDFMT